MKRLWQWLREDLTGDGPVCWFGGWFTHYGWGWNFRFFGGWVVHSHLAGRWSPSLYWSPNGTPHHPRTRRLIR